MCEERFDSRSKLNTHMEWVHNNTTRFNSTYLAHHGIKFWEKECEAQRKDEKVSKGEKIGTL